MYCTKCGAKVEEGAQFCMHCGAPVKKPEQAAQPRPTAGQAWNTQGAPSYPYQDQPRPYQTMVPTGKKKRNKAVLIIGIAAAAVVVIFAIIGVASLFGGSDKETVRYGTEETGAPDQDREEETAAATETEETETEAAVSYWNWGAQEWQAASEEEKYDAVIETMCLILSQQGTTITEDLADAIASQSSSWVESLDIYYGLQAGSQTLYEFLSSSTILDELFMSAQ